MQLLLLRHGIAEMHAEDGTDASRRLTDEGIKKTIEVAAGLSHIAHDVQVILTSPKVRARQTADIAGQALGLEPQILPALANEDTAAIFNALRERDEEVVMIVGHEPTFSRMIELIAFGKATGTVDMKKAGCARLDVDLTGNRHPPRGTLLWVATPKMLRKIGQD